MGKRVIDSGDRPWVGSKGIETNLTFIRMAASKKEGGKIKNMRLG